MLKHTGRFHIVSIIADSRKTVFGDRNKTVKLWNIERDSLKRQTSLEIPIKSLAFNSVCLAFGTFTGDVGFYMGVNFFD